MTFGQRISALREARGWSRGALAAVSGVSRSYQYQLESGMSSPTLRCVESLAAAFHLSPLALLDPVYAPVGAEPVNCVVAGNTLLMRIESNRGVVASVIRDRRDEQPLSKEERDGRRTER